MPTARGLYTVSTVARPAGLIMPAGTLSEIRIPSDSLLAALGLTGTAIHSIRLAARRYEIVIDVFTAETEPRRRHA